MRSQQDQCAPNDDEIDFIFTIMGKPTSQKNLKRAGVRNGKSFIYTPASVKVWQKNASDQLEDQWHFQEPIRSGLELEARIYSYLGKGQSIDADNLAGGPLDSLQKAGIIANDYWVKKIVSERLKDAESPRVVIHLLKYRKGKDGL